ncbi:unnamed protein product [Rotaria magnacalcarata]|uniref:Barrier-to-autointegration factor n=1 Tax=Rotaria magnacalcarata TaxID=392030 RepID=A0A816MYB3_9BILA|nr:unnamed protein product [Rotaria magnacalcarata]CAF1682191.1 unnamed protein product [Rotaria magnacalcarata]CAF2018128.1 unnamed protein product [Rotaria magnacalcarata]CAF2046267.1 unnamed protein product [Rotaria magnacalcarata]CAF3763809.1 unnamed protein product [Rotaria magnacalcarata]
MSSTTSQKFRDFTSEPLKDKQLNEVPGLGPKLASNLEQSGITKAYELLGIYLTLLKNKEYFELWIRDNAGANRHQAKQCADSIDAFCSQFL